MKARSVGEKWILYIALNVKVDAPPVLLYKIHWVKIRPCINIGHRGAVRLKDISIKECSAGKINTRNRKEVGQKRCPVNFVRCKGSAKI